MLMICLLHVFLVSHLEWDLIGPEWKAIDLINKIVSNSAGTKRGWENYFSNLEEIACFEFDEPTAKGSLLLLTHVWLQWHPLDVMSMGTQLNPGTRCLSSSDLLATSTPSHLSVCWGP